VSDDAEHGQARRGAEEAARRSAEEAATTARAEAERMKSSMLTGEMKEEVIRQLGLIYGGLILIGLYMVQPFLVAPSLDPSATVSVIAFAVAIPLLAALVLVNRQETFRGRRTTSVVVVVAHSIAQSATLVGIVAGFWHITWIAGVTFLVAALVAMGVHSAGFWRVEAQEAALGIDDQ
jgi:hypothetical protein